MYEPPYHGQLYKSLRINQRHPMSERYLEKAHAVYRDAFGRYGKLFMVDVTLRFPSGHTLANEGAISRFTRRLRELINRHMELKRDEVNRLHETGIHYVWCREVGKSAQDHYHLMLMLNGNTFRSLGNYTAQDQAHLSTMISDSWCAAIGLSSEQGRGLVHFSEVNVLNSRHLGFLPCETKYGLFDSSYEAGFYWLSYLCKLDTKMYGSNRRNFGCSQIGSLL